MKKIVITGLFLLIFTTGLRAQEPAADRMRDHLKSEEFSVGMLLQSIGNFSFTDDDFNGGNLFDIGATRLSFQGTVDNNFIYKMQIDFRRSVSIMDAQVGYAFSDNFRIITGAFKPFLSIDLDPNPGITDFINRARHVGAMMNSREIGITALGESGNLNYRVGMYNGNGLNRTNDGGFLYTARLGYLFPSDNSDFEIGLNTAVNQTEMERVGNSGLISTGDRILYGFFTQYDSESLFGTFEFLQTQFDTPQPNTEETITGFFATLGTHLSDKTDLLARWDHLEYDELDRKSELLTFGLNHQATQLVSFQVNLLTLIPEAGDTQVGLSGNFQFQF
ncbi:MAG: porin [Balneolaceae bacterium]|nr:porin [Balneolaceae bacterium]